VGGFRGVTLFCCLWGIGVMAMSRAESESPLVPPVRVRVGAPVSPLRGAAEGVGRRAARCVDCGLYTSISHAGRCEGVGLEAGVSGQTVRRLREGRRDELVRTPGMAGKRVRREVATMDLAACALEKGMSVRETGRVLGRLARAFNKQARVEAEERLEGLRGVIRSDE